MWQCLPRIRLGTLKQRITLWLTLESVNDFFDRLFERSFQSCQYNKYIRLILNSIGWIRFFGREKNTSKLNNICLSSSWFTTSFEWLETSRRILKKKKTNILFVPKICPDRIFQFSKPVFFFYFSSRKAFVTPLFENYSFFSGIHYYTFT